MGLEETAQPDDLVFRVSFLDHLLGRWNVLEIRERAKELLHFAGGLVDVDDPTGLIARETPDMGHVAR